MIRIVINSHKSSTVALDHLLESIKNADQHNTFEFIVVLGGFHDLKDYKLSKENQFTFIQCSFNSIDYNGLIALSDLYKDDVDNYYFYLHDTTKVGPRFFEILSNINLQGVSTMKMMTWYSMNMGIYSQKIINQFQNYLHGFKNYDTPNIHFKVNLVHNEDYIFRHDPNCIVFQGYTGHQFTGPTDYYGTGTPRIVEYYPNFDVYKIKGNWGALPFTLNL